MEGRNMRKTLIGGFSFGLILIVSAVIVFSSFYTVNEQEQAVITQFGKVVGVYGAGPHFKIPFIQEEHKVNMTTRGMEFGYQSSGGYDSTVESESFMITNDFNFVHVDFYVEWKVSDPAKYLFNSEDPVWLLRNILQAEGRSVVSTYSIDDVLTTAKTEIQTKIREGVVLKLDEYDIGIMVLNVSLQDATPPTEEVVSAFKNVENAKQNKQTQINQARSYHNEIIPAARAEADKIIKEAQGIKESRINEAKGEVAKFNEMYVEYAENKDITKTRMYLEAMESILPGINVYVDSTGNTLKILDLNQGDNSSKINNEGAYTAPTE